MSRSNESNDALSKLVEVLALHGPWPLVFLVIGITFILQLHKIIPAASAAWKQQKETDQNLRHKRITFEKKHNPAITTQAPNGTQIDKRK